MSTTANHKAANAINSADNTQNKQQLTETQRKLAIELVKFTKARQLFEQDIKTYGSTRAALAALDCKSKEEAISMLAEVQRVSIFKNNGKVIFT